jgi:DNA-directed RNA polymerase subunit K/omega
MTSNTFEFVVVASLRVRQLVDGCTPRVEIEGGKKTTIARREVSAGKVERVRLPVVVPVEPAA